MIIKILLWLLKAGAFFAIIYYGALLMGWGINFIVIGIISMILSGLMVYFEFRPPS